MNMIKYKAIDRDCPDYEMSLIYPVILKDGTQRSVAKGCLCWGVTVACGDMPEQMAEISVPIDTEGDLDINGPMVVGLIRDRVELDLMEDLKVGVFATSLVGSG